MAGIKLEKGWLEWRLIAFSLSYQLLNKYIADVISLKIWDKEKYAVKTDKKPVNWSSNHKSIVHFIHYFHHNTNY